MFGTTKFQCLICRSEIKAAAMKRRIRCENCESEYLLPQRAYRYAFAAMRNNFLPRATITKLDTFGRWLRAGEYEICIYDVIQEQDGSKIVVSVDVGYQNRLIDETLDCRRNQWVLFDTEDYSYDTEYGKHDDYLTKKGRHSLGSQRFINPNSKLRGWVAFQIPNTSSPVKIQFFSGYLKTFTVDFFLDK